MQYLITGIQDGKRFAFYTQWFDYENHFNKYLKMVVFDLANGLFLSYKSNCWHKIEQDHL